MIIIIINIISIIPRAFFAKHGAGPNGHRGVAWASHGQSKGRHGQTRQTDKPPNRTLQPNPKTPLQAHRHCTGKLLPSAKNQPDYEKKMAARKTCVCPVLVWWIKSTAPCHRGPRRSVPRCPRTKDPGRPEGPRAPSRPEGCGTLRAWWQICQASQLASRRGWSQYGWGTLGDLCRACDNPITPTRTSDTKTPAHCSLYAPDFDLELRQQVRYCTWVDAMSH